MSPEYDDDQYEELDEQEINDWFENAPPAGEFEPVPDGNYQTCVLTFRLARSKESGLLMLKTGLVVLGPTCANRRLWHTNMLQTPDNLKWLKYDLALLGIVITSLSDLKRPEVRQKALDKQLNVKVVTKGNYQNVYFQSRIDSAENAPW